MDKSIWRTGSARTRTGSLQRFKGPFCGREGSAAKGKIPLPSLPGSATDMKVLVAGFVSSRNAPERARSCSVFDHRNAVPVLFGI